MNVKKEFAVPIADTAEMRRIAELALDEYADNDDVKAANLAVSWTGTNGTIGFDAAGRRFVVIVQLAPKKVSLFCDIPDSLQLMAQLAMGKIENGINEWMATWQSAQPKA